MPPLVVKVRRYHQRGDTLLAETVTAIAKNVWQFSVPELSALPSDLAQLVFDELIILGKLTRSSLALFSKQHLYKVCLEDYPGVGNDWLRLLVTSPLIIVNLSRCSQVHNDTCLDMIAVLSNMKDFTNGVPRNYRGVISPF